jgi:hypothetical protein
MDMIQSRVHPSPFFLHRNQANTIILIKNKKIRRKIGVSGGGFCTQIHTLAYLPCSIIYTKSVSIQIMSLVGITCQSYLMILT